MICNHRCADGEKQLSGILAHVPHASLTLSRVRWLLAISRLLFQEVPNPDFKPTIDPGLELHLLTTSGFQFQMKWQSKDCKKPPNSGGAGDMNGHCCTAATWPCCVVLTSFFVTVYPDAGSHLRNQEIQTLDGI